MKKLLFSVLFISIALFANAYDFKVDRLCYNYNEDGTSVTVTYERTDSYGDGHGYTNLSGALNIPSSVTYNGTTYSVTSIGYYTFSDCTGLTSVTIPNSVTSIGGYAFDKCSGLTSVTIPNSVTSIGYNAFRGCKGLTSVTIPNSVTVIEEYVFSGCSGLTSIVVNSGNTKYDSRNNCNAIIEKATNTLISGCKNTIIPNSVTSIGKGAFYGCTGLTSVTIPNSVTSIDSYAFSGCSGLTSVTIPNSVTSIGYYAFKDCTGLTSVTIPNSVTSINSYAFSGCSGLTSVTIPNSVTSISESTFSYCTGLTSVTIPNSVTSIGSSAFYVCRGLTSVTIPNSVTSIGSYAFNGCTGLTSVIWNAKTCNDFNDDNCPFKNLTNIKSITFGNEVKKIPAYLCYNLTKLKTAILGENITSIGSYAFKNCSLMENLVAMRERPIIINSNVFVGVPKASCDLHVRQGSKPRDEAQDVWKDFLYIIKKNNVEKILMFSGLNKIVNHYSNIEEGINDMRGGII